MEHLILTPVPVKELTKEISDSVYERLADKFAPPQKEATKFVTRRQAAEILGISLKTLNTYTKKRILQSYRMGAKVLYKRAEIFAAIQPTNYPKP